ncbi:MAG: glycosyltransferase family A protein [Halioglobus sp.]
MSPRVSVVVPVHNGAPFLAEALDSARAQTIPDIELIVVDDGSTDTSAEVAQRHSCGVTVIRQPNQGPASARNQGVAAARGEYLAFLDADDLWPQGRLAWQLECFAQHPRTDMVQGRLQSFRRGDSGLEVLGHPHHAHSLSTALVRREAFLRVGPLDESLRYCEDVDWFFSASRTGLTIHRSERLALWYRRHAGNATNRHDLVRRYTLQVVARHRQRAMVRGS